MQHLFSQRQRFSLRKYSFGVASVLLGTALFLGAPTASADQTTTATTTTAATTSTDGAAEVAAAEEEIDDKQSTATYNQGNMPADSEVTDRTKATIEHELKNDPASVTVPGSVEGGTTNEVNGHSHTAPVLTGNLAVFDQATASQGQKQVVQVWQLKDAGVDGAKYVSYVYDKDKQGYTVNEYDSTKTLTKSTDITDGSTLSIALSDRTIEVSQSSGAMLASYKKGTGATGMNAESTDYYGVKYLYSSLSTSVVPSEYTNARQFDQTFPAGADIWVRHWIAGTETDSHDCCAITHKRM